MLVFFLILFTHLMYSLKGLELLHIGWKFLSNVPQFLQIKGEGLSHLEKYFPGMKKEELNVRTHISFTFTPADCWSACVCGSNTLGNLPLP